jgi:hypothetical protein
MGRSNTFGAFVAMRVALHRGELDGPFPDAAGVPSSVKVYLPYAEVLLAEIGVAGGAADAPERLAATELLVRENRFARALFLRARGRLHHDESDLEQSVALWEDIGARFERAYTLTLLPDRADEGARELAALGCSAPATTHSR